MRNAGSDDVSEGLIQSRGLGGLLRGEKDANGFV